MGALPSPSLTWMVELPLFLQSDGDDEIDLSNLNLELTPSGLRALTNPSDPMWQQLQHPDEMRRLMLNTFLTQDGDGTLDDLVKRGYMERHPDGKRYRITQAGADWVERGFPEDTSDGAVVPPSA